MVVPIYEAISSESFLEKAFLRWVLTPATQYNIVNYIKPQYEVLIVDRRYKIDYAIEGSIYSIAIELDGFEFHSNKQAFTYDRLRQNDLQANGWLVLRFSYDSIRLNVERCVTQIQDVFSLDPLLKSFLIKQPKIEKPEMPLDFVDNFYFLTMRQQTMEKSYFDTIRNKINLKPLRECQKQAFAALLNYFSGEGSNAACIMSVGAGKTALGVIASLSFTKRRAMVITPGSVIRGTFDKAFDHQTVGNVLYGLPGGPIIPGCKPPSILTLDRDDGPIRSITKKDLLSADIIITNFHSLGTGQDQDDLIAKLDKTDIDLIVVDEAHIAAADSYQRTFLYFNQAKTLLMSACFQRLDGKPIEADVVYRYRLIDSIVDGNAKNLRVHRFAPDTEDTTYEMLWPDGKREEIVGKESLLEIIKDEKKIARITAKSDAPIRQVMRSVKARLIEQSDLLYPIKPRVLFSALGERHAEQITRIAEEYGIPCAYLHYSMSDARIKAIRARFEQDSGDLQGIVQLKMLGQGYDFPPITIVVPMRPYGSFSEFYQFVGRGIRILQHPSLVGRVKPSQQFLDIVYHAELGLDDHIHTIYKENDTESPNPEKGITQEQNPENIITQEQSSIVEVELLGSHGRDDTQHPEAFVLFERGNIEQRVVHDQLRIEQRRSEREQEALAQRYALYVQSTNNPVTFEQFIQLMRMLNE